MAQFNYNNYYQRQRQPKKKLIITIERIWRRESWKRSDSRIVMIAICLYFNFNVQFFWQLLALVSLGFVPFDSIAMCVMFRMELMRRYFVFLIKFSNDWEKKCVICHLKSRFSSLQLSYTFDSSLCECHLSRSSKLFGEPLKNINFFYRMIIVDERIDWWCQKRCKY